MARQFASVHKHSLLLFLLVCYGHDTLAYSPSRTRYLLLANGSTRYSASPSWFGVVRASVSGPASLSLSLSLSFSLSLSPARLWKLRYALCHYPLLSFSVASLRGTSPELPVSFAIRQYPVSSFSSFFFSPSPSLSLSRPRPTRIRYASSHRRVGYPFPDYFSASPLRNRHHRPAPPCCCAVCSSRVARRFPKLRENFESQREQYPAGTVWFPLVVSGSVPSETSLIGLCPRGFAISNPRADVEESTGEKRERTS